MLLASHEPCAEATSNVVARAFGKEITAQEIGLTLHQLTAEWSGGARDRVLMPIVLVFVLTWAVASGTALISLLRGLMLKARGRSRGDLASSLGAVALCALCAPVWMMAVVLSLQAAAPR